MFEVSRGKGGWILCQFVQGNIQTQKLSVELWVLISIKTVE